MCGRYFIDDDETISEMRRIFREIDVKYNSEAAAVSSLPNDLKPSNSTPALRSPLLNKAPLKTGEIFPTDIVPVLRNEHREVAPVLMSWGFPKWQASGVIINARSETAAEKKMFSSSLLARRCLVPTNGFYEWNHESGRAKEKYLLRTPCDPMLYLAGLYAGFRKPDGLLYDAFVILTIDANPSVRQLHDRMPLIVEREDRDRWLLDNEFAFSLLHTPCLSEMSLSLIS